MIQKRAKTWAVDLLFFVAGSMIEAISVNMFTAPNHIAPGGITGIGIMLNHLFQWPVGMCNLIINIPIIIWAIIEIGYKLVTKTMIAIVLCSAAIDMVAVWGLPAYHGNMMLVAIFGGILDGLGLSLIFLRGSTTGGTDLIARLLGHRLRHLSMGKLMMAVDVVIIIASAIVFRSVESAMYAVIAIFVSTRLIDSILYGTDIGNGKMYFIISSKNEEIAKKIIQDMDRGVTMLHSRGGYSKEEGEMILCAVRRYEVTKINEIVREIDRNAFVIVGEAGEITGEGFRPSHSDDKTLMEIIADVKSKCKK